MFVKITSDEEDIVWKGAYYVAKGGRESEKNIVISGEVNKKRRGKEKFIKIVERSGMIKVGVAVT